MNSYSSKYFSFLTLLLLTVCLSTFVLAYKMTSIGNFTISSGILIFPLSYAILDLIAEIYGFDLAVRAMWQAIICELIFAIVVNFIVRTPAPIGFHDQAAFEQVLKPVLRFAFSNIAGVIVGFYINIYLISKLKSYMHGKHFWIRSIMSSMLGQLITSLIADLLAFGGVMSFGAVIHVFLAIYLIKFIYCIVLALPIAFMAYVLKKLEHKKNGINITGTELFKQNTPINIG